MADEPEFCDGTEEIFGMEIPFDSDVKYVIEEGVKEARQMDPEKRAQVIETAGYLAYDIMIVESLGDHEDAKVAKGRKEAAEKLMKDELKKMKSQVEALKPQRYPNAELLKEAKKAAEDKKEKIFSEGKPQTAEKTSKQEDLKQLESKFEGMGIQRKRKRPKRNLIATTEARDNKKKGKRRKPEDMKLDVMTKKRGKKMT